jgi:hypothetical protein
VQKLPCGHTAKLACHSFDATMKKYQCKEMITVLTGCAFAHKATINCFQREISRNFCPTKYALFYTIVASLLYFIYC